MLEVSLPPKSITMCVPFRRPSRAGWPPPLQSPPQESSPTWKQTSTSRRAMDSSSEAKSEQRRPRPWSSTSPRRQLGSSPIRRLTPATHLCPRTHRQRESLGRAPTASPSNATPRARPSSPRRPPLLVPPISVGRTSHFEKLRNGRTLPPTTYFRHRRASPRFPP